MVATCRPASQFCCGCSLTFGVKFILAVHLAINVLYIISAWIFIFREQSLWASTADINLAIFVSGYCLAGIPIILAAFWGHLGKKQALVQVYLFYMIVTFIMALVFIIKDFIVVNNCGQQISGSVFAGGQAYGCGMIRLVKIGVMAIFLVIMGQFMFVIWSQCEDVATGGGPELSELALSQHSMQKHKLMADHYACFDAEGGAAAGGAFEYGSVYAGAAANMLGSTRIFDGRFHEMQYPPHAGFNPNKSA